MKVLVRKNIPIVLPKLPFPRSVVISNVVTKMNTNAKELADRMRASYHAKYLVSVASGKCGMLPGSVEKYWEALQQVLEIRSSKG